MGVWAVDLLEGVNQCIISVGLESDMEVDGGTVWRVTQGNPVIRDDIPFVPYDHIIASTREGCLETN